MLGPSGRRAVPAGARSPAPGIEATVYLPDAKAGYYRGTRFDWSGAVARLRWNNHEYFGEWFARHDPVLHDGITGPVEEFLAGDSSVGYDEAKAGETFVRIGVGAVRKPQEPAYRRFATYEIVDPGTWKVARGKDRVTFIHELRDANGYGYVYTKVLRLSKRHAGARAPLEEHRPQADRDHGLQPQLLHDRQAADRAGYRRARGIRAARDPAAR